VKPNTLTFYVVLVNSRRVVVVYFKAKCTMEACPFRALRSTYTSPISNRRTYHFFLIPIIVPFPPSRFFLCIQKPFFRFTYRYCLEKKLQLFVFYKVGTRASRWDQKA
jgi:hypothetical protein